MAALDEASNRRSIKNSGLEVHSFACFVVLLVVES
jgi:hypothetical protein